LIGAVARAFLLDIPPVVCPPFTSQRTVFPGALGALDALAAVLAFQLGAGRGALARDEGGVTATLAFVIAVSFADVGGIGNECPAPFAAPAPIFPLPLAHG